MAFNGDVLQETLVDNDSAVSVTHYNCANCGINVIGKEGLLNCPFCHGNLLPNNDTSNNDYMGVIPFNITIDEAISTYKNRILFNPIVPLIFKKNETVKAISKIYIPAYLVDVNVNGEVKFLAGKKTVMTRDKEKYTELKKYSIKNYNNFDYRNILISLCSKIDDHLFRSVCVYDCQNLEEINFNDTFVDSDIEVDKLVNDIKEKTINKSLSTIKNSILYELKKLIENNLQVNIINSKKIYIPVYFLNVKYKDKNYQYIMNGQNGKFKINVPLGIVETIISSLLLFFIIFIISFLIAKYL